MEQFAFAFSAWSYGLAAVTYLILTFMLIVQFRNRLRGPFLFAASAATSLWAAYIVISALTTYTSVAAAFVLEILRHGAWLAFLSALLGGAAGSPAAKLFRFGGIGLAGALLIFGFGQLFLSPTGVGVQILVKTLVFGSLFMSLYALMLLEQVYRNARDSQRQSLKFLAIGVGGVFVYDLFVYSNTILTGQMSEVLWGARGFVATMCAPFLVAAVKRSPSWSGGLFVSRHIAFYTATLFGAGLYMTLVGLAGVYVQAVGGNWGQGLAILLFAAAILFLASIAVSRKVRARLRVFISKHFYENKFDYREEWLRLIATLTSVENAVPLKKRAVQALAQIISAPRGSLWLSDADEPVFRCVTGWNMACVEASIPSGAALPKFLQETAWLIDLNEFRRDSDLYRNIAIDTDTLQILESGYIVPLLNEGRLLGFIVLEASSKEAKLNYEDRDLLKTAGLQIASYLAQEMATERLAEVRQFEAFNKLTAYLMHDLKNVVAQQSLVVENAQRHKDNPAFIDDAVDTIRGSVRRIKKIIEHLQQTPPVQHHERVELGKLVMQAVSECADRRPEPRAKIGESAAWVRADPDRLLMALTHAVRNAQDACSSAEGDVDVSVNVDDDYCEIQISDNGEGMDEDFIRTRLFKPFDSTKGTQGMGIGAYQLRETVRSADGDVSVASELGVGTTLTIRFNTVSAYEADVAK